MAAALSTSGLQHNRSATAEDEWADSVPALAVVLWDEAGFAPCRVMCPFNRSMNGY